MAVTDTSKVAAYALSPGLDHVAIVSQDPLRSTRVPLHSVCPGTASCTLVSTNSLSLSGSASYHSLRERVSCSEVRLGQCLCESNESLPYRRLIESAKTEEQRIRIRASQSASIDGEYLNTLGLRELFRLS
jgi:hypothetical protein